jgi:hypothetical protein
VRVTLKTKMMLIAAAATLVLPVIALGLQLDDLEQAMDTGHAELSAADIQGGERPDSVHVTITGGRIMDARVESVLLQDGSERDRWHFHALRSETKKGAAAVLIMSKSREIDAKLSTWTGVWTNGDDGVGQSLVDLFRKQRVKVDKGALVIDIDASRASKIQGLVLTGGGAAALGLLVLVAFAITIKDDEKEEKKLRAGKKAMKAELEQTRLALRQAIRPYLTDPEHTVQVRANCLMSKVPQIVLAIDSQDLVAPPELAQIVMGFHEQLKKAKVPYQFMNYTTFHVEDEGWRDSFEIS